MKVEQKNCKFEPITITLETAEEAGIFIDIINNINLDDFLADSEERSLLVKISDTFALGEVQITKSTEETVSKRQLLGRGSDRLLSKRIDNAPPIPKGL